MIKSVFLNSLKHLRITIFWPIFLSWCSAAFFFGLFLLSSGLLNFILSKHIPFGERFIFDAGIEVAKFLRNNLVQVGITFAIFFALHFVVGSSLHSVRYGVIRDIINGKPQGIFKGTWNARHYAKTKFWSVVFMRVLTSLIVSIVLLLTVLITAQINPQQASTLVNVLVPLFIVILFFFTGLLLLFRYAYIFMARQSAIHALKHSMSQIVKHPRYVILVGLIVAFVNMLAGVLQLFQIPSLKLALLIIMIILVVLISMWQDLFIFEAFTLKLLKNLQQR